MPKSVAVASGLDDNQFVPGRPASGDPFGLVCPEPSLTKQSFKEECDINEILRRAMNGQDVSGSLNARVARYGDFTNVPSYQEALDVVSRAEGMFMELDADLRARFQNDPAKLLEFISDDRNRDEAIKIGLIKKPEEASKGAAAASAAATGGGAPGGGTPAS